MADTTLRVVIAGDASGLVAAMDETAAAADASAATMTDSFAEVGAKAGGLFEGIGNTIQNLTGGIIPLGDAMESFNERFSEATTGGQKFTTLMSTLGGATLIGVGVGLAGAAAESIKLGMDFQEATSNIAANADISQAAAKKIGDAFLTTAGTTTFSATEMATAYSSVAGQLGEVNGKALNAKQALDFMRASTDLAEASGSNLSSTTKTLASIIQTFGLKSSDAAYASDTLYSASRQTGVSVDQLGSTMQRLEARMGVAGGTLTEMSASLVDLANHGVAGSRGLTVLNTAMNALVAPSAAVQKAQEKLGLTFYNSQGQFVGFRGAIQELQPILAGHTQQEQIAILTQAGLGTSAKALLPVIDAGTSAWDKAAVSVSKAGAAHEAAEKSTDNLKGSVEKLKATADDLGTEFGEFLIPKLTELGDAIAKDINWFEKHKVAAEALAAVIATVLGGAIIAFVATKVESFVDGIQSMIEKLGALILEHRAVSEGIIADDEATNEASDTMFGVWGIVIAGIIALVVLLATHWQTIWAGIRAVAEDVWNSGIKPVFDALSAAAQAVWGVIDSAWTAIDSVIDFVGNHIVVIIKAILAVALGPLGIAIDLLWTHWNTVWSAVSAAMDTVWGILKPIFDAIVSALKEGIEAQLDALETVFSTVWIGIQTVVSTVWGILKPIFDDIEDVFNTAIGGALHTLESTFTTVWHAIQSVVQDVWDIIKPIFDTMKSVISTITSGISGLSSVASSIGHGVGSALSVIGLASGGLVTKPTLAVVGEAGPEMVIPLSQMGGVQTDRSGIAPLPVPGGAAGGVGTGGYSPTYAISITAPSGSASDIKTAVQQALDEHDRQLYRQLNALGAT